MQPRFLMFLVSLLLGLSGAAPAPTPLVAPHQRSAPAKPKLTSVKLSPALTVGVPAGFTALPDDGIAAKYPAPRKPLAVYSNPSGRVDFSVALRPTPFLSADYAVLLKIYKASILRLYTKVEFIAEDIRTVNGRDFIAFEFVSTVADNRRTGQLAPIRRYQAVQYAIKDEQLYVFTFVAPAEEQAQWQPTARAVMGAISLK